MCICEKMLCKCCCALIMIGALNWGLVGLFNLDLIALIFGNMTILSRMIYILIGLAGVHKIIVMVKCKCSDGKCSIKKKK